MKALAKTKPQTGAELVELPDPTPGPHDVVFAPEAATICGSDVTMYRWEAWAPGDLSDHLPFVLGHEGCGQVVAVGGKVTKISVGDRAAAETHIPCGQCWYCHNDRAHVCPHMSMFGVTVNGCFGELAIVDEKAVWKVSPDIESAFAAMLEPLGVGLRAAEAVDLNHQPVVILGAGPIGLLAAAVAATHAPAPLIVVEPEPARRKLAAQVGAGVVIDPAGEDVTERVGALTDGLGVEVVIDCSGHNSAIMESLGYLRRCGHLVVVGVPHEPLAFNAHKQIIHQELQMHGVWGRKLWETWQRSEQFIREHSDKLLSIITSRYALADAIDAFEKAAAGKEGKVMLDPRSV